MTAPVFLVPLGIEAAAIRRAVRSATIERIGMGQAKATAARTRIALERPTGAPLALLGLGGGLLPGAKAGDVIVGSSVQRLGSIEEIELAGADQIVDTLRRADISAHAAPIVSSPRILHGSQARSAAALRGAAVVDMESFWCAGLADTHSFSVCRVLSDVPGQDLWSLRTPSAMLRALRVVGEVARALHHARSTTVEFRSVEEADL
jgi:4-hydroxy-3-methylbut-2-enyl diphosphate reductase